ncbi:immunoglobulin domain-containing protein [Ditylenchus destructor]|uniref:Immunoglobulin domain-containing protein n=1 Tax=Ditylenchus destructor TaxID=166010 RepID=A0AAD4RDF0_9BILA|nr:immunoglobulin domain-containing protein [Ditylenchus destructor]
MHIFSLGDVSWEIAVDRDTQDVRALEVEQCDCPPGYIGTSCEDCAPGYERSGSGPYLGTCVPRRAPPAPQCSSVGAISVQPSYDGRCQCKQNTVGATCDRCAPGSFQMSPNNPQGCLKCFCSGVTNQCDSSSLRRCTVEIDYARGARDQLEAITKDARSPFRPPTQPQVYDGAINFNGFYEARGQTLYWKMPQKFVGNKISSYGGKLKYVFRFTGSGNLNPDPDVIIRGNDITLHHYNRNPVQADRDNTVEIPILEDRWQRSDGQPATREHLLMALADTDDILIKMSYMSDCSSSSLVSAILDCADQYGPGPQALEVEECQCPIGYVGTSCEDCAPGYSRTGGGLYLGLCEKCECNGHASECDKEYGTCVNCQHNTEGDQCERCKPGFEGDARRGTPYDCQQQIAAKPPCQCYNHSPRGCDSFGRCLLCEHNTEGFHCETCKKGFYGDATRGTPYDCTPCPCPGASDCFLDSSGQVQCRNCPAGFSGRLCDEYAIVKDYIQKGILYYRCAPGYTRSQASGGRDCEPIGRVYPDHITFVPEAEAPLHVQILPPKHLSINEGSRAKWTCKVSEGYKPEQVDLRWTKIGEPDIPSHVRIQGNQLIIDSVRMSDAGQYRCTGSTPKHIATDDASLIVLTPQIASPHTQTPKPIVTPPHQIVDENQQAVFTCLTPGFADCEVEWHFNQVGSPLPPGVYKRGNQVFIPAVQTHHAGDYICTVQHQFGRSESNPGRLEIKKAPLRPMVDPPEHNVEVGDPARFRCWVPGVPDAVLTWRPIHGGALPAGSEQRDGFLNFPRADLAHEGQYICAAHDPSDDPTGSRPVDSEPVRLNIRQPTVSLPPAVQQAPQVDPLFQTVDVGQPAKIRCWVPGDPNARLRWSTHHHRPLPAGATDQEGILTFPSVSEADDGGYICSVSDPQTGGPIHSPVARIHVRRPQKPQIDPPEQTVRRGQPARIRCWVPDSPHSQLTWNRRGGAPLPDGARDDGRGNLYIAQTQSHHVGDYECTATDPQAPDRPPQVSDPGRISLQPPVEEAVETPGQPPRPVATPPILTVKRGEEARFHCDANSPSPAEIHWGYGSDNGPLRGDTVQEGDDVVIPAADDADAGEYICSATNRFGSGRSDPVRLVITDNEEPPTARVEPKVWNGKPGERHQFKCHTTGIPPPQVSWSKNGGNGLPDDVVDLGDGVLEISNARKEHEGDYTCHAVNIVGEASDFGTVNVGPSLTVITTPAGPKIILTVGEPLEVKCEAFGDPDPDVEWLHDPGPERGDLPDDFVPVTISEQFIRHPKIGLGNAGRYTCKGSNQFASVTRDIYIEVVEPSHLATVAILGGTNQWFPVGQEAQLVCAASGSSVVDRLEWTSAGSSNLPAEASDQGEPGLLHFDTFKPSHEGEYECNAYRKDELIASSKVHIYSDANLRPDVVHVEISPPNVRVVNKGDSIVLDCIVHGHSDDFKYSWSLARGGSLIRQLGKESQLTIKSADPTNDYGIYRCEVDNEEGDTVGSAQVAVAVGYESSANAQEAKFDESSEAILTCPVFVVPGATVSWTKQGDDLPTNSEQKDNKLVIENFDDTAAGIYTCTVIYGQSTVEGFVNAKIFVPDTTIKVEMKVSAESVHVGERVWLDCVVVGDANAKIEFSKDGSDKLPSNAQITGCDDLPIHKNVTGNRLIFTEISEENTGKYLCTASTSEGQLIASALLNVEPSKRKRKDLPSRHSTHGSRRVFAVAPAASSSLSPTVAALTQPQLSASLDPQNPLAVSQQRLRRLRQQRRRRIASRRQKLKRFSDHEPAVTQNKGRIQRHHSSFKDSAKYHHYDVKHPSIEQPAKSVFGSWFASN